MGSSCKQVDDSLVFSEISHLIIEEKQNGFPLRHEFTLEEIVSIKEAALTKTTKVDNKV